MEKEHNLNSSTHSDSVLAAHGSRHTVALILEKISFVALIVTIILAIVSFTAPTFLPMATVKTFVISIGVLVSAIFFFLSKIKSQNLKISLHPFVWIGFVTAFIVLLASLFSPNISSTFFGKDFATDTTAFLLILFVAGGLVFSLTRGRENRIFFIFSAIVGSFSLLAVYHIIRFFTGPTFLSFGIFTQNTYTTLGSWHDLGILAGVSLIISLVTLELLPITNKLARSFFIVSFILASIILVALDLPVVWTIVAVVGLAFTIYKYLLNQRKNAESLQKNSHKSFISILPLFPLVTVVISLLFLWSPGSMEKVVNTDILTKAGISYTEVNLPWSLALDVAEPTIKNSPLLGAGPDRFVNQYLLYKPAAMNSTQFWDSDFTNANSFILTSLVTEGVLGFVMWIILVITFFWFGAKILLCRNSVTESPFARYGAATAYFAGGFLWLSIVDYMPQHATLFVAFIMTGILAAHLIPAKTRHINFSKSPVKVPMIIIFLILIAGAALLIVFYTKDTISEIYFQSAIVSLNNGGSLSKTAQDIQSALNFEKNDVYYQAISQMDVYAIDQIVSNATSTPTQSEIQLIEGLATDGVNSAHAAEKIDPTNPYGYLAEAQVEVVAAGIGFQGAYAEATSSYQEALTFDPSDPSIYLALAKLNFFEKNEIAAKNDLGVALELKPNYTDALFEVGVVSYTDKDYASAVQVFTEVQQIDPSYPNIQADINLATAAETVVKVPAKVK